MNIYVKGLLHQMAVNVRSVEFCIVFLLRKIYYKVNTFSLRYIHLFIFFFCCVTK